MYVIDILYVEKLLHNILKTKLEKKKRNSVIRKFPNSKLFYSPSRFELLRVCCIKN